MWSKTGLNKIKDYHTYSYEHLDDLSFLRDPREVFTEQSCEDVVDAYLAAVRSVLLEAGWEGDGPLRLLWFPPFVDVGTENTHGTYVWVVKQSNNGTSWIASPVELPFPRLMTNN